MVQIYFAAVGSRRVKQMKRETPGQMLCPGVPASIGLQPGSTDAATPKIPGPDAQGHVFGGPNQSELLRNRHSGN